MRKKRWCSCVTMICICGQKGWRSELKGEGERFCCEVLREARGSDINNADLNRPLVRSGTACGGHVDGDRRVAVAAIIIAAVFRGNDGLSCNGRVDSGGCTGRVGELVFDVSGFAENPVRRRERRLGLCVLVELVVPEQDIDTLNTASGIDLVDAGERTAYSSRPGDVCIVASFIVGGAGSGKSKFAHLHCAESR